MPVSAAQLLAGANYQLESYAKNDPIDQFTTDRPFSRWLIKNKVESVFGNGIYNEKVRITNDSNYQNYSGDDQVSYNRKDTVRLAPFQHYEAHDGFSLNETELANNGIILTDDRNAVMTEAEKIQIVSKIREARETLKDGFQENWDLEMHRSGSLDTNDCPGLDHLVSVDGTGTVGGIVAGTQTFWKNNFNTGINVGTAGTLTTAMETEWRKCMTYGKMGAPNAIFCGSKFYDAYRDDALDTINRQLQISGRGGTDVDASVTGVFFKGVPVIWDPSMDAIQTVDDPTIDWDKRCYFLNSRAMKLRPFKGRWMVDRKPSRIYDRYTHYFALTSDYGFTAKQRNAMSLLSIA